jgi:23S rRNA pseudouridine955/2504/2580 synthase/23S rRNA pseudouridine1911/1915/1917 synthase
MSFKLHLVFEDEYIIALNKPSGLLSIPDRFDANKLNAFGLLKATNEELFVIHRIDKETSGLLVFAKTRESHKQLNQLFEDHLINKTYLCVVESFPEIPKGIIDKPIAHSPSQTGKMMIHPKGKQSQTKYELIEKFNKFSLIHAEPITGRTHQIRVHMASIGCPILCDPLYSLRDTVTIADIKRKAQINDEGEIHPLMARTALHAFKMDFQLFNKSYNLEAELPKDMKALLAQLKKWARKN